MKAIVNREVAERQLADEDLQASVDRQIRSVTGGAKGNAGAGAPAASVCDHSACDIKIAACEAKIDKGY